MTVRPVSDGQPTFTGGFVVGCAFAVAGLTTAALAGREPTPFTAVR
jgi:hypothetical protein